MANERLTDLSASFSDVLFSMSSGNPGAINVMVQILEASPSYGLLQILFLDALNIWDSHIWMFYKDCCGEDVKFMLSVLKACQQGDLSQDDLRRHVQNSIRFDRSQFVGVGL